MYYVNIHCIYFSEGDSSRLNKMVGGIVIMATAALASGKYNGSPRLHSENLVGPRPHELINVGDLVTIQSALLPETDAKLS